MAVQKHYWILLTVKSRDSDGNWWFYYWLKLNNFFIVLDNAYCACYRVENQKLKEVYIIPFLREKQFPYKILFRLDCASDLSSTSI